MFITLNKHKLLSMICVICMVFECFGRVKADGITDDTVIASVNGREIMYKQIRPSQIKIKYMQLTYSKTYGREMTAQELEIALKKAKKEKLASEIHKMIKEQAIIQLGIVVTQKEIEKEVEKKFELLKRTGALKEEKLKQMQEKGILIIKALKAWQKNPNKSKQIYKNLLGKNLVLSPYEWEIYKMNYDTSEKLVALQKMVMMSVADMKKNSYESTRKDILNRKLREYFAKGIQMSEAEVEAYYKKKKEAGFETRGFAKIKDSLKEELLKRKKYEREREFFQEQIRKADIEIKDERFKGVINLLLSENSNKK